MEASKTIFAWTQPAPSTSQEAVTAAVDEFVLSDGTKARVRIEGAGPSMLVTFLDSHGDALPGSPVELSQDFSESAGRISIVGHWAPARRLQIAEDGGHNGLLRTFVVYGCRSVRFFQYARNEVSLDAGSSEDGVVTTGREWRLDNGSPYRGGTFGNDELEATGMLDGPGTAADFNPFEAVVRMADSADGDPATPLADDAVFAISHEFETLPYADGVLLGSIRWGYTLTWTLADAASAGPVPRPVAPVWRPPDLNQGPMPTSLGTSWNPRGRSSSSARRPGGAQPKAEAPSSTD